jgi:NADH:ubiquinone oxidoreductase subunit D
MTTIETAVGTTETMVLNMGPQHPSTHGVLRVVLELDGETVVKARSEIGYLHTGIEKSCEALTYSQAITLTDRIDYLAPLSNNLGYCLAVEKFSRSRFPSVRNTHSSLADGVDTHCLAHGLAWYTRDGPGRRLRDVVLLP